MLVNVVLFPPDRSSVTILAELVNSRQERRIGLQSRPFLPVNEGMLFEFSHPQVLSFWMKDTLIPLDLIFINANNIVTGIHENAQPYDTSLITVGEVKNRYVLEVNAGLSQQYGICVGTLIEFS